LNRWDVDLCDPEVFKDMFVFGFICVHKNEKDLQNQTKTLSLWTLYGGRETVVKL
jgi:hypothetical protein